MTSPVSLQRMTADLVLASGSKTRRDLLNSVGLDFEVVPSTIDEDAVKAAYDADNGLSAEDLARVLAEAKASEVSKRRPSCFVLGCDQTLEFEGRTLSKSPDVGTARRQLLEMRGKAHTLHSSAVLVRDGVVQWTETASARMTIRNFTPEFLGHYLALAGDSVLDSVGGYQVEGLGIHLFEKIEGDHFTILGLPLMPLLSALRGLDVLES